MVVRFVEGDLVVFIRITNVYIFGFSDFVFGKNFGRCICICFF